MSCTESSADTTVPSAVTRRVIASDAIGRANGQRTEGSYGHTYLPFWAASRNVTPRSGAPVRPHQNGQSVRCRATARYGASMFSKRAVPRPSPPAALCLLPP
jgi:hypothetical protein